MVIASQKNAYKSGFVSRYKSPEYTSSCYTCGICNSACPVNAATSRLRPMELVYKKRLGLLDELVALPDIWYCIDCGRCSNLCPMMVKPFSLIQNLRNEAVLRKTAGTEVPELRKRAAERLTRALWHAADSLLNGEYPDVDKQWDTWAVTPPADKTGRIIRLPSDTMKTENFRRKIQEYGMNNISLSSCLTCRECSAACPICLDPSVFDPLRIFRLVNLGFKEDVLRNPAIWMCLDCRSCSLACTQKVDGALVISRLQHAAYEEGFVDKEFPVKWQNLKSEVYGHYIEEIDQLLENSPAQ